MLIQKETQSRLREIGLNTYESKIWAALLSRKVSTAGELSDIANVPRSRSYDVLESLEKKGFVIAKKGKPIKYTAVSPDEAIENVKKRVRREAEQKLKGAARELIIELSLLHSKSAEILDSHEIVGALKGRENFYNQFFATAGKSKNNLTIIAAGSAMEEIVKNIGVIKKLSENGVKIKIFAPKTMLHETAELSKYSKLDELHTSMRVCIADKREMVFAIFDDSIKEESEGGIWLVSPYLAAAFEKWIEKN